MIFNIIIALIGCITGCTGLIISIYRAFLERGKLTANVNEDHCWYFPKVDEYAASVNQAVVSVLLINRSIYPVTIYKISVQCGKFDYSYNPYPDDSISVPSSTYFLGDSPVTLHINTQSQIDLPYVIPPFGVYDGVLFFPKFSSENSNYVNIKLQVYTSRKNIKTKAQIQKWNAEKYTSKIKIVGSEYKDHNQGQP